MAKLARPWTSRLSPKSKSWDRSFSKVSSFSKFLFLNYHLKVLSNYASCCTCRNCQTFNLKFSLTNLRHKCSSLTCPSLGTKETDGRSWPFYDENFSKEPFIMLLLILRHIPKAVHCYRDTITWSPPSLHSNCFSLDGMHSWHISQISDLRQLKKSSRFIWQIKSLKIISA